MVVLSVSSFERLRLHKCLTASSEALSLRLQISAIPKPQKQHRTLSSPHVAKDR